MNAVRIQIAVAIGFIVLIFAVGVMVVLHIVDQSPGNGAVVTKAPAAHPVSLSPPPATTQSSNAADSYAEAFDLFHQLRANPADIALFGRYEAGNAFDDQAGDFFNRYAKIDSWVRQGAAQPACDWGETSTDQRLHMLNDTRAIAVFMGMHARYAMDQNDTANAVDDLVATLTFARHVGRGGLLVNKLVEVGIEQLVIDELSPILVRLSPERARQLRDQLDQLPEPLTGKQMIQIEHDTALRTAREQNQFMQIAAIDSMDDFYHAIADAMDQPPETFNKIADEELTKLPNGSVPQLLAKTLMPALKRARLTMTQIDDRYSALHRNIDAMIPADPASSSQPR